MAELSIIVPCYNEEKNLAALVDKCAELLKANHHVEIILVNNGSTDNSEQILQTLIEKNNNNRLRSYLVKVNRGYGFGILEGLNQATGRVLCWTHADLQTDIFDCIEAYNIYNSYNNENILIKGLRKKRAIFDIAFTSLMSFYVFIKLRKKLSDINGQPKLFSKKFYETISANAPHDFSLDLYFLLNAKSKGRIVQFPVFFHKRLAGEAKGGSGNLSLKIKLTRRTINYINNLRLF